MSNLPSRKEKIKEKRKQTPWRDFVKEIASWMPVGLQKNSGVTSRYPEQRMNKNLYANTEFAEMRSSLLIQKEFPSDHFFDSFEKLWSETPFSYTIQQGNNQNTNFADSVLNGKDVYLSFGVFESCRNIFYSILITNNCENVFNSCQVTNFCENIYQSIAIDKSSFIFYSKYIQNSHHIYFSTNMVGCNECIMCDGLENQSFCINNIQLTKEEYMDKKAEILSTKDSFHQFPDNHTKSYNFNSTNVTGNCILFSNDIENGHFVTRANTGRNLIFVTGENDDSNLYDICDSGINGVEFYAVQGGGTNANNMYCSSQCETCSEIYYSYYLFNCSYCVGCIGLQNQSYCIFNKQYEKEEWHAKIDELFGAMEKEGTLGQFFPGTINPFYFNDTVASFIEDFDKDEVVKDGYLWRDDPLQVDIPDWMETVHIDELGEYEGRQDSNGKFYPTTQTPTPSRIHGTPSQGTTSDGFSRYIDPAILKKVIKDEHGNVYRIIKTEYDFLVKHGLPLPRKHRLERLKNHFLVE